MIHQILDLYCKRFVNEAFNLRSQTAFLNDLENPCSRSSVQGHVTGSGIVIQNCKILLIKHRYINDWFQPGGHIDPGELPSEAAIRETEEETGWQCLLSDFDGPIDIDVHLIPENPLKKEAAHIHVDFAYLLNPVQQVTPTDPEMTDWFDFDDITAPRLKRIIDKYLNI